MIQDHLVTLIVTLVLSTTVGFACGYIAGSMAEIKAYKIIQKKRSLRKS